MPVPGWSRHWLVLWLLLATLGLGRATADPIDAQAQVTQLLQNLIDNEWNSLETAGPSPTNRNGISTNIEAAFRRASELMPARLDLRFGIASALLGEALQTNGPALESKVKGALGVYQEIMARDTDGFAAPILYAAFARAIGETNEAAQMLRRLTAKYPSRTAPYAEGFNRIEQLLGTTPNERPSRALPAQRHAIIILGAGLETNGTMRPKLFARLKKGLKLARLYPDSPILLTGGNARAGVTEAYMMSRWCLRRGIRKRRLILEDKARDTVENALYCSLILKRLGVTSVTVVTSASHVRRALADFEQACRSRGLGMLFDHLAARIKTDKPLDPEQERLGVYRDAMRTSGLWAYPGLRR